MHSPLDIFCSASATTPRIPIISRAYSPCGSVYYHILFVLALVLAAAYLCLVRLALQPPVPDTLSSEPPRAAPGRNAAVASVSPCRTLPSEQVAPNTSSGEKDAPPRQHESLGRLSPTESVPKGRNTATHAASPDAHTARPPSRSPSTPVPSAGPRLPSPDVTQGNAKPVVQRGASLPTSGLEPSRDYVPTSVPYPSTTKSSRLKQVLYVGSKEIAKITSLDILVIPYDHQGTIRAIRDPKIDAKYLCERFVKLKNVTVRSLPDDEVTLDRIKEAITARWEAAQPGTCLLVLLTGHGDDDNAMMLHGDDRIDESYLDNLFHTLHQEHPKQLRVGIVFDICRENREKAAAEMHSVALIWACSPGQKAWAFKFKTLREPSSVFLLALLIATHDTCRGSGNFEEHLKLRVTQLAKLNNHVKHLEDCEDCDRDSRAFCHNAFVMRDVFEQDVDLGQSQGFLNDLYFFLDKCKGFYELSKEVTDFMLENQPFLQSNGLPSAHPLRGANEPVSQVLSRQDANSSGSRLLQAA